VCALTRACNQPNNAPFPAFSWVQSARPPKNEHTKKSGSRRTRIKSTTKCQEETNTKKPPIARNNRWVETRPDSRHSSATLTPVRAQPVEALPLVPRATLRKDQGERWRAEECRQSRNQKKLPDKISFGPSRRNLNTSFTIFVKSDTDDSVCYSFTFTLFKTPPSPFALSQWKPRVPR
jgi:hypothetical protein